MFGSTATKCGGRLKARTASGSGTSSRPPERDSGAVQLPAVWTNEFPALRTSLIGRGKSGAISWYSSGGGRSAGFYRTNFGLGTSAAPHRVGPAPKRLLLGPATMSVSP